MPGLQGSPAADPLVSLPSSPPLSLLLSPLILHPVNRFRFLPAVLLGNPVVSPPGSLRVSLLWLHRANRQDSLLVCHRANHRICPHRNRLRSQLVALLCNHSCILPPDLQCSPQCVRQVSLVFCLPLSLQNSLPCVLLANHRLNPPLNPLNSLS